MKGLRFILPLLVLCGCTAEKMEQPSQTVIMYMSGYNNLAGDIATNIELELTKGDLPEADSPDKLIIFAHCAPYMSDGHRYMATQQYRVRTAPVLIRAYRENGKAVLDTLKFYNTNFDTTEPENVRSVLEEIKGMFPSDCYGLVLSGHGTGWLPADDTLSTRAIGSRFYGTIDKVRNTDIKELASSLPMHFDYIIMDACLMGAVEVVYQFRNSCDRMIVSEIEIPSQGFDYARLPGRLFKGQDLEQICKDYMVVRTTGGTISLIDCRQLEPLAAQVRLMADSISKTNAQKMWCNSMYSYFYDLRSLFPVSAALDEALSKAVLYEQHSSFVNMDETLRIGQACGLSMYYPNEKDSAVVAYYRTLDFCKATGVVK